MSTVDGVKGVLVCLESEGSEEDRHVIFSGRGNACHVTWVFLMTLSAGSASLCANQNPPTGPMSARELECLCFASDCASMLVKVKLQDDFVVNVGLRSMLSRPTHLNFQIWPCFLTYLNAEGSV